MKPGKKTSEKEREEFEESPDVVETPEPPQDMDPSQKPVKDDEKKNDRSNSRDK